MTLYIGVDFHPYQQTVAWCDTQTGETETVTLLHEPDKVRAFYEQFETAVIGIEASSRAQWFEDLLSETKHELRVGNPYLIRQRARSRHKSDRRDAQLILELLLKEEFPTLWRRSRENNQVLDILKLRHNLVRQRTQTLNRLQALARSYGMVKGSLKAQFYKRLFETLELDEVGRLQRAELLSLLASLNERLKSLEEWLEKRAAADHRVALLRTQGGVGYLTALAVVNVVGELSRFTKPVKQVPAYVGLEPLEKESAGKRRRSGISRAGNALTRYLLGQAGHLAIRSDARLKAFYKRLAKKKPKGVAKTATARKLLVKLVIMWRDKITAEEFDRRTGQTNLARSNSRTASSAT